MLVIRTEHSVTFVYLIAIITCVQGHFNLFISQEQVRKLLGLSAELFYVREGVVNTYAMNFVVPIPSNVSEIEFSWQSLLRHPLPYTWSVQYNNGDAMLKPTFNITLHGHIPTLRVETFRITFPCTGLRSAEVHVLMQLNVSTYSHRHNKTSLNFRRNKICLKDFADAELTPRNDSIRLYAGTLASSGGTLYVAVGCACGMILLLLVGFTSVAYVKSNKVRTQESVFTSYTSGAYAGNPNLFIRMDSMYSGSYATIVSLHKTPLGSTCPPSPYATSHVTDSCKGGKLHVYCRPSSRVSYYATTQLLQVPKLEPSERIRRLTVLRHRICPRTLIQEGTFGRIYRGSFQSEDGVSSQDVLVKTVSEEASKLQTAVLLAEGTMMYGLVHANILNVIAANTNLGMPPLLVYPYTGRGNLKRFLCNCRTRGSDQVAVLTQDLVDMAIQIATAGSYMHSHDICHKDLATRNCVIDEKLHVKVADSALSRDLFPGDYHCLGDNENRPVKWLALESLVDREFTPASDVWAFGVVLWELITLAQQPYAEIDPFEVDAYLRDGYRLAQPVNCPDQLFDVMTCCWSALPDERPSFAQLLEYLRDFSAALGRYV